MRRLVGGDKGRDIAYQLPSQARRTRHGENSFNLLPKKHRQTLKQHPSSFPPRLNSHFSRLLHPPTPERHRGNRGMGALRSGRSGSSLPPFPSHSLLLLWWGLSPKATVLQEERCLQHGLLLRLQYLLRHHEAPPPPPPPLTSVSLCCLSHSFPPPLSVWHFLLPF